MGILIPLILGSRSANLRSSVGGKGGREEGGREGGGGACQKAQTNKRASYLCTYYFSGPVCNVFDACRSIPRASGRGMGPRNIHFFGPEMATSETSVI